MQSHQRANTGTLGKALAILDAIVSAPEPLRFTDLLQRVKQPRGTLHRHLRHLLAEDLIAVGPGQTYEPGIRALHFAAQAWRRNGLRRIAEPFMRDLNDATGETVHLGLLRGQEVIYLDKLESRQAIRMHSQIGRSSPVYCTGVGKAALATLPPDELRALAQKIHYRRFTPNTLTSARKLLAEVTLIRREGIAYDREEHEEGIFCVASPIAGPEGRFTAGISVTAPAFRATKGNVARWGKLTRQAAEKIQIAMSDLMDPRG